MNESIVACVLTAIRVICRIIFLCLVEMARITITPWMVRHFGQRDT